MERAYEDDLRRKLLAARTRGEVELNKLAVRFKVSYSWAQKLCVRVSRPGRPSEYVTGPLGRMSAEVALYIRAQVKQVLPDLGRVASPTNGGAECPIQHRAAVELAESAWAAAEKSHSTQASGASKQTVSAGPIP